MADDTIILPLGNSDVTTSNDVVEVDGAAEEVIETVKPVTTDTPPDTPPETPPVSEHTEGTETNVLDSFTEDEILGLSDEDLTKVIAGDLSVDDAKALLTTDTPPNGDEHVETITEVEIDGVVYTLDENGNALNEANEVKFTSDELKEFQSDGNEEIIKDDADAFNLAALSSIQPVDEMGKAIQYTNDADGQRRYIEDVYKAGAIDRANQVLQERFNQNPLIEKAINYITVHNSLEGFSDAGLDARVTIDSNSNEETLVQTIRQARKIKGDSEIEIANTINWAKADNKLFDLAKISDDYLINIETAQRKELAEQAAIQEANRINENKIHVSNLINTINNGKLTLNGQELQIPAILERNTPNGKEVVTRDELINYATRINQYRMPDGSVKNATQYQIDKYVKSTNKDINSDIVEMINLFTGSTSNILKSAINSEKAKVIRTRMKMKRGVSQTQPSTKNSNIKLRFK